MKYQKIIRLFFIFLMLLSSCKSRIDQKDFTLVEVLNGNTVRLKNGLQVQLLGVYPSRNSFNYLTKYALNKKIRIRFDSKLDNDKNLKEKKVYAYLLDENNNCINSILLRSGIASLDTEGLNDSLESYSSFSSPIVRNSPPHVSVKPPSLETDDNRSSDIIPAPEQKHPSDNIHQHKQKLSIQSIASSAKGSVFIVYSFDDRREEVAQGTGFFIAQKNIAVSNYHVFQNGDRWLIKTNDNEKYFVSNIIKYDKNLDYVVFQVEKTKIFKPLRLCADSPQPGEDIVVIGNPLGLANTITRGIISALRSSKSKNDLIQIDAAISEGSSGSPVLNLYGEVIGIATKKIVDCENCNFAVSIKLVNY